MVSKYEKTRIMSARALQLAQGATPLVDAKGKNTLEIAVDEMGKNKIPLVVV
jgi:DNA-directed RNA polymerase subunit K/omega